MDFLFTESGKFLITQGVLGVWALLATIAAVLLYRAKEAGQAAAAKSAEERELRHRTETAELYDKRLTEALSLVNTMNRTAEVLSTMGKDLDERAAINAASLNTVGQAINLLAQDFTQWRERQGAEYQGGQQYWRERIGQLDNRLTELCRQFDGLRRTGGLA